MSAGGDNGVIMPDQPFSTLPHPKDKKKRGKKLGVFLGRGRVNGWEPD